MSRSRKEPEKPTPLGHAVDFVVFRSMGALLIVNEVKFENTADWHVLIAGFAMFFMPDALRGKSSLFFQAASRFFKLDPVEEEESE